MQTIEGKPEITYPTLWEYRLITQDAQALKELVQEVCLSFGKNDFDLKSGQSSSGGKFVSLVLNLEVESEEERNAIFAALKSDLRVKMVL